MAGERLPERFSFYSELWFRWTDTFSKPPLAVAERCSTLK